MPTRGQQFWVPYTVLDGNNRPLAGDLANHTLRWWADGTDAEATNNQGGAGLHVEIGGGEYAILITADEADCVSGALTGTTTTASAVIVPRSVFTEAIVALSASERAAVADAVLTRSVSNVEDTAGANSLCYVVLAMAHANTTAHAGKLTVFKTSGSEFVQKTLTSSVAANPPTGIS